MKKILIFLLLLLPLVVFGQEIPEPPADLSGFVDWFKAAFGTWAGALAVILILTERVKRWLNVKGTGAVIVSWIASLPIVGAAWYFGIGIVAGVPWYVALIYALSFAISANIAYLAPLIKEAARVVIDLISSKKESKLFSS
jgi:hypothetical protein